MRRVVRVATTLQLTLALAACGEGPADPRQSDPAVPPTVNTPSSVPPVRFVIFTHIEDATPAGVLGSVANRTAYLGLRSQLIQMAAMAGEYQMRWSLEPDWKVLLAALQYEDAATRSSTAGLNLFRFLRDSLNVAIDAHSHEGSGYNYTDVAHLLDSLGVGGSSIIGGHIWDPSLPQFSAWDRFRVPVRGSQYPSALWRGDILMGSGTPNHVNDPILSGVWRPRSRDDYFTDDPAGNIVAVGAFRSDLAGVAELLARYRSGQTPTTCMFTASMPVSPSDITGPNGLATIENAIVRPLAALRDSSQVVLTDFTALVATWRQTFGAKACTWRVSP